MGDCAAVGTARDLAQQQRGCAAASVLSRSRPADPGVPAAEVRLTGRTCAQAPLKQEAPLLLEIFGIIFGGVQAQELAQAEDGALADATNQPRRQAPQPKSADRLTSPCTARASRAAAGPVYSAVATKAAAQGMYRSCRSSASAGAQACLLHPPRLIARSVLAGGMQSRGRRGLLCATRRWAPPLCSAAARTLRGAASCTSTLPPCSCRPWRLLPGLARRLAAHTAALLVSCMQQGLACWP